MAMTDTNGDAPAKKRRERTKVVMYDGRDNPVMTSKGEPSDDPTEAQYFTIQCGALDPIECRPFDFNEKIKNGLVIFGAKQRFTNAIGGLEADEANEKVSQILEQMQAGEAWSRTGQGPRVATLLEALVRVKEERGEKIEDVDALRTKLRGQDAKWLTEFSQLDDVASMILQIKAEKAKAAADAAKAKGAAKTSDFSELGI